MYKTPDKAPRSKEIMTAFSLLFSSQEFYNMLKLIHTCLKKKKKHLKKNLTSTASSPVWFAGRATPSFPTSFPFFGALDMETIIAPNFNDALSNPHGGSGPQTSF